MKQLSNLDFLKAAKILNVLVDPVASDDTGLGIGQLWFNTTSNFFKGYDGTNKFSLLRDDLAATITGVLTFNPSSGTVPFAVNGTHTSVVTNLNADRVDGYHAAEAATASTLGARDASGNLTVATPTSDGHAATKAYVDSIAAGQDWKDSCRVATTANITLSGTQTIDGVSVVADDRVLVKDQTTASQNGIYVCAAGAWSRAIDADADAEVTSGLTTFVEEGTLNSGAGYTLTTSGAIVVGTTSLTFTKTSGGSVYGAGNGMVKSGTTFHFGQSASYTVGALPYANGASTIGFIAAVASGKVLKSNGETTVPLWASLDLTADVGSSILPVANGGTGTATQFTSGSVVLAGASGVYTEDNAGISFDTSTDRLTVGLLTVSNIPSSGAGNEVVVSESGALKTQTIDSRVWGSSLVDGGGSSLRLAYWSDGNTLSYFTDLQVNSSGQLLGGFGAAATTGTLDWDDSSNARPGNGYTLLQGVSTNGPSADHASATHYFHPFCFEYDTKDATGNMTQFAIPYNGVHMLFRYRFSGVWTGWYNMWNSGNDGAGSGLDADLLDGQHGSYYLDLANSTGDTDDISEGLTNLFYTDARARAALSSEASAEVAYNSTTGAIGLGTEAGRVKSGTIGDESSTSLTFSHNLGTRDVMVQVFRTGTPYDTILVDVARNTTNQVTIGPFTTAPTSGEFTVVCSAANG